MSWNILVVPKTKSNIIHMNKFTAIILLLLLILVTLPVFFITIPVLFYLYNSLVKKNNQVDFAYSSVDVMLKKRSDLIPNVIAAVNKIMMHEKDLLERITELRTQINQQDTNNEKRFELENEMGSLLGQVSVNMENYPELKSNENMLHLQRTLNETEEQISAARRMYNAAVVAFNTSIQSIPTNMIAALSSYQPKTYFEASEQDKANPSVKNLFGV